MKLVDKFRTLGVRTNADTPEDAKVAREFGAEGIGLFRTEHMFYGDGLRRAAVPAAEDDPQQDASTSARPPWTSCSRSSRTTSRPRWKRWTACRSRSACWIRRCTSSCRKIAAKQKELAKALGIDRREIKKRGEALHETNPMMGHRGVRLGITYPEVTEMQIRAILEAAAELNKAGKIAQARIMVPVTCDVTELDATKVIFDRVQKEVEAADGRGSRLASTAR